MNPRSACSLSFLIHTFLFLNSLSAQDFDKKSLSKTSTNDQSQKIDINNIEFWVSNNGRGATDHNNGNALGFYWPKGSPKSALYNDCFVLVGKVILNDGNKELRAIGGGLFAYGLQAGKVLTPGKIENNVYTPALSDDPLQSKYRVYKIQKNWENLLDSDLNKAELQKDYLEWPKEQGAPVDDNGNPLLIGDQTLFSVSNDLSTSRANGAFGSKPIGIELQTTVWAYKSFAFEDVIFVKRKFINKSGLQLDSMYFSIYSDPDIGDGSDDLAGCDSLLGMIYCYHNKLKPDATYGYPAPSFGYTFLETPLKHFSTSTDTAIIGGNIIAGKSNLGMTAVFGVLKSWEDYSGFPLGNPIATKFAFNYSRALTQSGKPQLDIFGHPVKFAYSGNPVTGEGDVFYKHFTGGDMRLFGTSGPFKFQPGDTQTIVYAMIIAKGKSNIDGVTELKGLSQSVKRMYTEKNNLPDSARSFVVVSDEGRVGLSSIYYDSQTNLSQSVAVEFMATNSSEQNILLNLKQSPINLRKWSLDTLVISKKYPYRYKYIIDSSGKKKEFVKWSDYISLRPSPSLENIEIIAESGVQDKKYNPNESLALKATFKNNDINNEITDFSFSLLPEKHSSVGKNGDHTTDVFLFQENWGNSTAYKNYFTIFDGNVKYDYLQFTPTQYASELNGTALHFKLSESEVNDFDLTVADQTMLTGHDYKIEFLKNKNQIQWKLTDKTMNKLLADSLSFGYYYHTNLTSAYSTWVFDGMLFNSFSNIPGGMNYYSGSWVSATLWSSNYEQKFIKLNPLSPEDYVSVKIDFAGGDKQSHPNEWSKAYMYKFMPDSSLEFLGLGDVPFKVWDTENNRQLNVCTRDNGDLMWNMGWNGTDFPDLFGNNEWIFFMKSDYNVNGVYDQIKTCMNSDIMYFLKPSRPYSWSVYLSNSFSFEFSRNKINKPGDFLEFTAPEPKPLAGYKGAPFIIFGNNYPNPFNPSTTIQFELGRDYKNVSLIVYNILGQQIKVLKNEPMLLGSYNIRWDGKNENQNPVSSGIYFYRLVTDGFSQTKKMILLK